MEDYDSVSASCCWSRRQVRAGPEVLIAYMRSRLPLYMVPASIEVRDHLPKSPNGKFDRSLLKAELA